MGNTGPGGDYADIWKWSCCDKREVGPVIHRTVDGVSGCYDFPPPRSPGCKKGPHEADDTLRLADSKLLSELAALQSRLREVDAFESRGLELGSVFISYSHADSDFVEQLVARFSNDRVPFWRDEKDILVGDVIDRAISEGIQKNSLFLVVLTPASIASRWVARELDEASHEATDAGKVILPVLAKGLTVDQMPARVRRFKCADFNSDFAQSYTVLYRSIQRHAERSQHCKRSQPNQAM